MSRTAAGCNYQGHDFGAQYLDSVCIDGYLWDADSGNPGEPLCFGGEIPCPRCDPRGYAEYYWQSKADVEWEELTSEGQLAAEFRVRRWLERKGYEPDSRLDSVPVL